MTSLQKLIMVRKNYIFLLLVLLVFNLVSCQHPKVDPPNVLWITIEDTSPQFIGCYGNKDARTPVIDQLAKEGVRFTNAFSTGTVCSPSRTAIFTGVKTYKTGTGNHRSAFPLPENMQGFPYYLKQLGYYTSNNLKTDYNLTNEKAHIEKAWNESSNKAGWWNREEGQPFFSVFNFVDSHQSRTMTETYDWYIEHVLNQLAEGEQIGDDAFEMPPFYKDTPTMRKQIARVYNSLKLTDNKIGALLQRLDDDGLKDNTIILFYADHGEGIPRGKTNGINLGYRVPFIVWFPEKYKHLSPWGTQGAVTDELITFEDLAPTLISLAGGELPSHLNGRVLMGPNRSKEADHLFISSDRSDNGIDMVRTVTNGKYVYSRNFMPYMPELRYIRYMEIGEIKQEMRDDLRKNELNPLQKSLFEPRPSEFLYNIENDIWETKNLANNPEYQNVLKEMRRLLKQEMLEAKDVMLLPEYELNLISKEEAPYAYRLSDEFDCEQILNSAWLSGQRGKEVAQQQLANLQNSNKIVRYWAAVGLRSQASEWLAKNDLELKKAMDDAYPPVTITAAAIVYDTFNDKKAENILKKYCMHTNNDLALLTIHYLMYVKNKQPFAETVKESRLLEGRTYNPMAGAVDFLGSIGLVPNNPSYRK